MGTRGDVGEPAFLPGIDHRHRPRHRIRILETPAIAVTLKSIRG